MYVALTLPTEVGLDLLEVSHAVLQPESHPGLRVAPPEDWHITLAFLGDVPDDRVAALHVTLARIAARTSPLSLRLCGAGRFDDRVLWVGVGNERGRLEELAESLRTALAANTDYPFSAHVTLGLSDEGSVDLDALVSKFAGYRGPSWKADRIHLMRSHPGPGWGVDESVASWPLEGRL